MWVNKNTSQVYKLHSEIRKDFKNVSMPPVLDDSILSAFDILPVTRTAAPQVDHTKNVSEGIPVLVDGTWTQVWAVTDASTQDIEDRNEQAAQSVRSQRDNLLASTDWLVIKAQETGVAMDQVWATYRQALRDITSHPNFPYLTDADWPAKPE